MIGPPIGLVPRDPTDQRPITHPCIPGLRSTCTVALAREGKPIEKTPTISMAAEATTRLGATAGRRMDIPTRAAETVSVRRFRALRLAVHTPPMTAPLPIDAVRTAYPRAPASRVTAETSGTMTGNAEVTVPMRGVMSRVVRRTGVDETYGNPSTIGPVSPSRAQHARISSSPCESDACAHRSVRPPRNHDSDGGIRRSPTAIRIR